ncbi:hypothetical protein TNCV_4385291 [Trichonephila clavipes]|nr:hypothetical protein TNCV_4385291 [Trichonephila clavipes]
MSDGMVKKWVRQCSYGSTNDHDGTRRGWGGASVINDGLAEKVNDELRENGRFTIKMLSESFHKPLFSSIYLSSLLGSFFEESK